MKTKIAIMGIILLIGYMVMASTGEPNKPDKPLKADRLIVLALAGIQDAIGSLTEQPEQVEKEWYHQHFEIDPSQNDALFVVPANRQFVLRRLYAHSWTSTNWYLAANETTIVPGSINMYSYQSQQGVTYKYDHDFPDGSITVNANETLNTVNEGSSPIDIMVVGYFREMPL